MFTRLYDVIGATTLFWKALLGKILWLKLKILVTVWVIGIKDRKNIVQNQNLEIKNFCITYQYYWCFQSTQERSIQLKKLYMFLLCLERSIIIIHLSCPWNYTSFWKFQFIHLSNIALCYTSFHMKVSTFQLLMFPHAWFHEFILYWIEDLHRWFLIDDSWTKL